MIEITLKGQEHLEAVLNTSPALMTNISENRIRHDVILFYLDRGEELEDIYFKLVDAYPGDPETGSRKFAYEVDQAHRNGYIVGTGGLGFEYEDL